MELKQSNYVLGLDRSGDVWQYKKVFQDEQGQPIIEDITGPVSAILELTNRCNLECVICLNKSGLTVDSPMVPFEKICEIIDELYAMNTTGISLSGGEPFLRKDIFDIFEYARDKLPVTFSTNGTLLTENMVERLCEDGLAGIMIALHSCNPRIHDTITGVKGSFQKALHGVEICMDAGVNCVTNMTLTQINAATLNETIDFVQQWGCDMVVNKFLPIGRGKENQTTLNIPLEEYRELVTHLYRRKKELKGHMDLQVDHIPYESILSQESYFSGCDAGINVCKITPSGNVHTCQFIPLPIGNVYEQSFRSIWKDSPSSLLTLLRRRSGLTGTCATCRHVDLCGGCRASAYAYTGDIMGPDPYCIIESE
jgi:radical SAM protein with 4Fe4S-binding SPASM domain